MDSGLQALTDTHNDKLLHITPPQEPQPVCIDEGRPPIPGKLVKKIESGGTINELVITWLVRCIVKKITID